EGGVMIGRKVRALEGVVPTDQEYSSLPVYLEATYGFRRLVLGMGEKTQTSRSGGRRYRYGINVDCSIGGMPRKGPAFVAITPASTGEYRDFVEALYSGANTLFGLAGRYVQRRAGDTAADWSVSRDLGVGRTAWQGVRFKDAGGSPIDALYVSADNNDFWQYNSATNTWTQLSTTIAAKCLAVLDDELWRGYANRVIKCTSDPSVLANWSGEIVVGDASSSITWMQVAGSQLFIFKDDGTVHSVTTAGIATPLDPGIQLTASVNNGRAAANWFNRLWTQMGEAFFSITPGTVAEFAPVGPERLLENDSEVRGKVQCSAGHQAYFLYEGLYNAANGHSYLLKYGTWLPPDQQEDGAYDFAEAHHGALKKWSSKQITAMRVSGLPGTNERLYCGFADGSVEWCVLPKGSPDPMSDSACTRTPEEAFVAWPIHHMMFQADIKAFRGWSAFGPALSATNSVQQEYRTDLTAAYTALGTNFTSNGQRVDPVATVSGKFIDCKTVLVGDVVLEGMALHEQVRPALKLEWSFLVDARDRVPLRNGATERRTPTQIRTAVKNAVDAAASVTALLPDETSQDLSFVDYQEVMLPDPQRYGQEYGLLVRGVQYRTNTLFGTYGRLETQNYGQLAASSYGQLEAV
ncbi:MAG TPA: hypothetical protein VNM48_02090, partial [Chloroflexota bacterium]|nr:hypothetical protein [Chloroflexota bacterium]